MTETSAFGRSLRNPWQWVGVGFIVLFLSAIAIGPLMSPLRSHHVNLTSLATHAIGLAIYSYANDNNGKYPVGSSSTEVFQKLVDGGYVTDTSLFYSAELRIPGKSKATTNTLKAENVCWDVTIPADMTSDSNLPILVSTGYRIEYTPNGRAVPISKNANPGIWVFRANMAGWFVPDDGKPDGIVTNFLPATFDAKGVKYVQLTPDGPLQ